MIGLAKHRWWVCAGVGLCAALLTGCRSQAHITDTAQSGSEQLLLSTTADSVIRSIDFHPLAHHKVYLDASKVGSQGNGYLAYRIREELGRCGAHLVETADDADVVVEVGVGAYGTDSINQTFGISGADRLPDINFAVSDTQYATSQLSMSAYDRATGQAIWHAGPLRADGVIRQRRVLGTGPYYSGTVEHPESRIRRIYPGWSWCSGR